MLSPQALAPVRANASARAGMMSADRVIERDGPLEPADLGGQTVGAQKIPHPAARPDDLKRDAARREFIVQRIQHAGAREIEVGRGGEIADHGTDTGSTRRAPSPSPSRDTEPAFDVEQRCLRAESDQTSRAARSPDDGRHPNSCWCPERGPGRRRAGAMRGRAATECEASAASRMPCRIPRSSTAHNRDRGGVEVDPAHAPHAHEAAKIEQARGSR